MQWRIEATEMIRSHKPRYPLIILASILLLFACGRKAPPVPPRSKPPPVIKDLTYSVLEDNIELQWTVPAIASRQDSPFAGCTVHKALRNPEEAKCKTCPIPFKRIADLPVPLISKKGKASRMTHNDILTPGFNHVYKVVCYTINDRFSEDSNFVMIDY